MKKPPADSAKPLHEACAPITACLKQTYCDYRKAIIPSRILEHTVKELLPVGTKITYMEEDFLQRGVVVDHDGGFVKVETEQPPIVHKKIYWSYIVRIHEGFQPTMPKEKE